MRKTERPDDQSVACVDPAPPHGDTSMNLYCHPISTSSRPVMRFAAENHMPLEMQVVDLFTGEHVQAPDAAINPSWKSWASMCSAPTTPARAATT
jgi:hypothetical protein